MENVIEIEYELKRVHSIVDKVLELILKSKNILIDKRTRLEENWTAAFHQLNECKSRLETLNSEKRTLLDGASQSGKRRHPPSIVINQDDFEKINGQNSRGNTTDRKIRDRV